MVGLGQFARYCIFLSTLRLMNDELYFSGRWGNVMVDKFTLDILAEIEAQSIVSMFPHPHVAPS